MTETKMKMPKPSNTVTVYKDANDETVAVERCAACEGRGCDGCRGLGFIRLRGDNS